MPKYELDFEIECGEQTCASEPGKFCIYCRPHAQGDATCYFFGKVFEAPKGSKWEGWLLRHPKCWELSKRIE